MVYLNNILLVILMEQAFKNDNPADTILTLDYGDTYYAAIPWNNLPADKKTYIGWMIPNPQPTSPWKGQMSIPRDLSLVQTKDGYRLMQYPTTVVSKNLDKLSHNNILNASNIKINNEEIAVDKNNKIKGNAYWINAELSVEPNTVAGFKIAQQKDNNNKTIAETVIGYDAANHQLYVDRTNSGGGKVNEKKLKQTIDIRGNSNTIKLTILLDKSSLEVFVNDGEAALTTYIYPAENADKIAAFANGGNAVIKSLKIWDLSKANSAITACCIIKALFSFMKSVIKSFVFFLLISSHVAAQYSVPPPAQTVPAFEFARFDKTAFTNKNLASNKPLFFFFFDCTCEHCQHAMTYLNANFKDYKNAARLSYQS